MLVGWAWAGARRSRLGKMAASTGHRPFGLIFWQLVICALVSGGDLAGAGQGAAADAARAAVLSWWWRCMGTLIPNCAFYVSVARLPAGIMSILISTVPMMAFPLALALGHGPVFGAAAGRACCWGWRGGADRAAASQPARPGDGGVSAAGDGRAAVLRDGGHLCRPVRHGGDGRDAGDVRGVAGGADPVRAASRWSPGSGSPRPAAGPGGIGADRVVGGACAAVCGAMSGWRRGPGRCLPRNPLTS